MTATIPFSPRRAAGRLLATACFAASLSIGHQALADGYDFRLPASEYGKTVLSTNRQSLGDAAQAVATRQNVFEPIGELREDDPLRRLTRAVGRLDIKVSENGNEFVSSCTATIVGGKAILTNYHCIPGLSGKVLEASILLDFYDADSDTTRLKVATEAIASDPGLDFSVVDILDPVPASITPAPFGKADIRARDRMLIVHHPAAQPKMMTQFGCMAAGSLTAQTNLRHRCDTLPGSSGAPIFNRNREIVGIHHSGGLSLNDPKSFNAGTRLIDILERTDLIQPSADATDPRSADTAAPASEPAQDTSADKPSATPTSPTTPAVASNADARTSDQNAVLDENKEAGEARSSATSINNMISQ